MAAQDFKVYKTNKQLGQLTLDKDSATVLRGGTFITLDGNKLAIEADATSAAVAYTEDGAAAGATTVSVYEKNDVFFVGTADRAYAATDLSNEVDIVINSGVQEIDLDASSTDVLKVVPAQPDDDANQVGQDTNVVVKINKFLFDDL